MPFVICAHHPRTSPVPLKKNKKDFACYFTSLFSQRGRERTRGNTPPAQAAKNGAFRETPARLRSGQHIYFNFSKLSIILQARAGLEAILELSPETLTPSIVYSGK